MQPVPDGDLDRSADAGVPDDVGMADVPDDIGLADVADDEQLRRIIAAAAQYFGSPVSLVADTAPPRHAGHPVRGPSGRRLGALCIIDERPRSLDDAELSMLRVLAEAAQSRIAEIARSRRPRSRAELLAAATNAAGIGLWEWDLGTDVLTWDAKMYELYGLEAADFAGAYTAWAAALHPDDAAAAESHVQRLLAAESDDDVTSGGVQFRVVRPDGAVHWIQSRAMVIRDEHGAAQSMLGLNWDITTEKELEAARLSRTLNESEKMEALGRLAGGVAHDFTNILEVISTVAALARNAANGAEIQADLGEIVAAAERAASLTRQLLTAYQPSAGLHLTDVNQRVAELTTFLSTALGASVDLNVRLCDGPAVVLIDPAELDRVIINLALNARDAVPGTGTLDIEVTRVEGQPDAPTPFARLTVSDAGVRLNPDARRVAEPFLPSAERHSGAGLSLFTCYGIITEAGGTITASSVEGAGTMFTVDLPLLETARPLTDEQAGADQRGDDGRRRPPDAPAQPAARTTASILVVEDDEALRMSTRRILEHAGSTVTAVSTIGAARQALAGDDFDLVISDVQLPDGDGMDFVSGLKDTHDGLPVLLWTGEPTIDAATRAVQHGVAGFLVKPVPAADLVRVTHDAIVEGRRRRFRNRVIDSQMESYDFLAELSEVDGALSGLARIEEAFDSALASLRMHYQPIVHAADGSDFAYEALLRCNGPWFASPPRFIAAAELLGRINDVGLAVRASVARLLASCEDPKPTIFVNLHPAEVRADLLAIPTEPLLPFASHIVLEITERAAIGNDRLEADLMELRACGYRIAVDDLGEGYAGLSSLVRVNPDIVKIDMSLVSAVDRTPLKQDVVSAIVGMARPNRILVVAEGVETEGERAALRTLGCDLLQGHLFGQPGPFVAPRTAPPD